jgi:hypothetical protein
MIRVFTGFLIVALLAATAAAHWMGPSGAAFATERGLSFGVEAAELQTGKINPLEQRCSPALGSPQIRCPLEHASEAGLPLVPLRTVRTAWPPTGRMHLENRVVAAAHGPPKPLS